jgi:glycosyltransferase involved in cell wall biosynthesis
LLKANIIWSAGGTELTPLSFLSQFSWRGRIYELGRNVAMAVAPRLLLTNRLTRDRAHLVLSASAASVWPAYVPALHFPLGGLSMEEIEEWAQIPILRPPDFIVLSIGRLLPWKGFSLGMRAFAKLRSRVPKAQYWIVGNGMEREYLHKLAEREGVLSSVKFIDQIPREKVKELLSQAHVLLHPSLHEQFGYVLLEAMAAGLPVVGMDVGGPAAIIEEDTGFRVKVESVKQVIADLASALETLAENSELRACMGATARVRVTERWRWDVVGGALLRLYEQTASPGCDVGLASQPIHSLSTADLPNAGRPLNS